MPGMARAFSTFGRPGPNADAEQRQKCFPSPKKLKSKRKGATAPVILLRTTSPGNGIDLAKMGQLQPLPPGAKAFSSTLPASEKAKLDRHLALADHPGFFKPSKTATDLDQTVGRIRRLQLPVYEIGRRSGQAISRKRARSSRPETVFS